LIEFVCPSCGKKHKAPDSAAGKVGKCQCGKRMTIPKGEDPLRLTPLEDGPAKRPARSPAAKPGKTADEPPPPPNVHEELFGVKEAPSRRLAFPVAGILVKLVSLGLVGALLWHSWEGYKKYDAGRIYINGRNALTKRRMDEALRLFRRSSAMQPRWAAPRLYAASLTARLQRPGAREDLEAVLSRPAPANVQACAHANLAGLALRDATPDAGAARTHLEKALELDENFKPARLVLAAVLLEAGETKRAAALARDLGNVTRLGSAAVALHGRVRTRLAFARGDAAGACRTYLLVTGQRQPDSFHREMAFRALALLEKGSASGEDVPALEGLAARAADYAKTDAEKAAVQRSMARFHARAGRHAEAVAALEKAGAASAGQQLLLADTYARAMLAARTPEEKAACRKKALALYGRVLEDDALVAARGSALVRHAIGFCDAAGADASANAILQVGVKRFPKDPALRRRAARRCFVRGEFDRGREHLQAALRLDPKPGGGAGDVKRLKAAPVFAAARAEKRAGSAAQPLLYVRVASGSPFPIDASKTAIAVDGKAVAPLRGGAECFYRPAAALPDGKHTVTVRARDVAGNAAGTSFDVIVDSSPPKAALAAPVGPSRSPQPVVEIRLSDASGIAPESVRVYVKNGPGTKFFGKTLVSGGVHAMADSKLGYGKGENLADPARIRVRVPNPLAPGAYLVEVSAADRLGHAMKATLEFRVKGP
jgi:tetratricopeptide (TPR) repeat protein/methionine-rich copper-binding protein CopC